MISFTAVDPAVDAVVFTVARSEGTLDGAAEGTAKLTPFDQYPRKGRATGGVRCQRFLRGESGLSLAWAAPPRPRGHLDGRARRTPAEGPAPRRLRCPAGEAGHVHRGPGLTEVPRPGPHEARARKRVQVRKRAGAGAGTGTEAGADLRLRVRRHAYGSAPPGALGSAG